MATASMKVCKKCGDNRAAKFYRGTRGTVCADCRKRTRVTGTKDQRLKETYNISHEEWLLLLAWNDGKCWICNGKRTGKGGVPLYDTDHDHALEKQGIPIRECLRGLLCKRCNRRLLPSALDSVAILEKAIWYLTHAHAITQEILAKAAEGHSQAA